jgi:cell wall-associated NlpC family hydrolase
MSHFLRRIWAAGLVAAAVATVLTTGPAQAVPAVPQVPSTTTSTQAPLATNLHVVTFSQVQRKVAVVQIRKERVATRAASMRTRAVEIALAQVGDNYTAGGSGPNAFDCSGLTLYAWRRAGVQLEHRSYDQYHQTKRIPVKEALPGDLVFYLDNGAHHVGMYIGRGKIVNASDYGVGVIISPMKGTAWTNAHFTGVGRVV